MLKLTRSHCTHDNPSLYIAPRCISAIEATKDGQALIYTDGRAGMFAVTETVDQVIEMMLRYTYPDYPADACEPFVVTTESRVRL